MIHVAGSPIGGENPPHDKRWRAAVATAAAGTAPATAVQLDSRLEPHRTVDLTTSSGPPRATARRRCVRSRLPTARRDPGDQDAGSRSPRRRRPAGHCRRGRCGEPPDECSGCCRPRWHAQRGDRQSKRLARNGAASTDHHPRTGGIDIAVSTGLSLEGLLKPIIDGLDPILGVDPPATLEFTPNDDRVEWLRIHRQPYLPCAIVLAAGSTAA